jgi:hypothetical protein
MAQSARWMQRHPQRSGIAWRISGKCSTWTATASRSSSTITASRAGTDIVGPIDYSGGSETPVSNRCGARRLGVENMAAACV